MAKRICANCKNPMGNSWSSIWVTKNNSVYCHIKCLKEYSHKLVGDIIINAITEGKKLSSHHRKIFDKWHKEEFSSSEDSE